MSLRRNHTGYASLCLTYSIPTPHLYSPPQARKKAGLAWEVQMLGQPDSEGNQVPHPSYQKLVEECKQKGYTELGIDTAALGDSILECFGGDVSMAADCAS